MTKNTMNIQELIQAVIDEVRSMVRHNDVMNEIAQANRGIEASIEVLPNGEFQLIEIKFIGTNGTLYVNDSIVLCETNCNMSKIVLYEYDGWNGLLQYGMSEE